MRTILKMSTMLIAAAAMAACGDDGYNRRRDNGDTPGTGTEEVVLRANPDWTITGPERITGTDDAGYKADYDVITVESIDNERYYLDIMYDSLFRELYSTDISAYLNDEIAMLREIVTDEGSTFTGITSVGTSSVEFNRLRSGKWRAVAFGVSSSGNLTGDYQMATLTVNAEPASDGFNSWLGSWTFTGADKGSAKDSVSYNVTISSSDPDYLFTIKGWETGNGCQNDMSDYSYEARYDRFTNTLLFMGQYIETYTDDNRETFDFGFYGNFQYDGSGNTGMEAGELVLTEDVIIAEAFMDSATGRAKVEGLNLNVYLTDSYLYQTEFTSMQYYDLAASGDAIYSYNDNVPAFPVIMNRVATAAAVPSNTAVKALTIKPQRAAGNTVMTRSADGMRIMSVSADKVRRAAAR